MEAELCGCSQVIRRKWHALVVKVQCAAAAEAKAAALKAEAAVQAAPFSAVALVERAQADADWAAILDALRLR